MTNLEANLEIKAPADSELAGEVRSYFEKIWNNEGADYTAPYSRYQDKIPFFKYALYRIQKAIRFTTY